MAKADPDIVIFEDPSELVKEGIYDFRFLGHKYVSMFQGSVKLIMDFKIISYGEFFEIKLQRYYNVQKAGRSYHFKKNMDFTREMRNCFDKSTLKRGKPFSLLKDKIIFGSVRTVNKSSRQKKLSKNNQYSVISEILGLRE